MYIFIQLPLGLHYRWTHSYVFTPPQKQTGEEWKGFIAGGYRQEGYNLGVNIIRRPYRTPPIYIS
jgi:hypothetical protein